MQDQHGQSTFAHVEGDVVQPVQGSPFGDWQDSGQPLALDQVQWLPPVQASKVIALWKNFHALAIKQNQTIPEEPLFALRAPSSLAAHRQHVIKPSSYHGAVFYEGELALIVGKRMKEVAVDKVRDYLLGCTIANDVSAMELINRDPSFAQWSRSKSYDTFGVIGPWIDTTFDWTSAHVHTRVNGRERQNYPLSDMIFEPLTLLSRLSHDMTLEPGDVVLCGTSVGSLPMRPDTEVEVEIDGLGVLSNRYN